MYKKGIFANEGKSYPLLTRFSAREDLAALRLGVKIFGVDIPMLPPPGPSDLEVNTQDFIFDSLTPTNGMTPTALAALNHRGTFNEIDVNSVAFFQRLLEGQGVTASLLDNGAMRSDDNMLQTPPPPDVLTPTLYNMNVGTTVVNRFGSPTDPAARFFIRGFNDPATGMGDSPLMVVCVNESLGPELQFTPCVEGLLQEALGARIQTGPLEMPLYANLQSCGDSIEDATTPWSTTNVMQVATLRLTTIEDLSMCNSTAFTPWHSAEDLRPLGSWQRGRLNTYYQGALQRGAVAATSSDGTALFKDAAFAAAPQGGGSSHAHTSLMVCLIAIFSFNYVLGQR
jgi:hypothetical protein